jgi:riboflavin synthase
MFTGIIEEVGIIKTIINKGNSLKLTIFSNKIIKQINLGDSVAVNGVCLTVTFFDENTFSVDVSPETYNLTSLKFLKQHSKVNLETALTLSKPLGGHIVSGHVDGIGKILSITPFNDFLQINISIPTGLRKYMIKKGSITVDGISLTINNISNKDFSLMIIPHTMLNTTLVDKKVGDYVNIEVDLIAKYIENFVRKYNTVEDNITKEFLSMHGFA